MILPTTYLAALLLSILSMLCWGSWANTFKLTRKWRFELFYFDYAFGVMIAALIAAFTFGSSGDGMSFLDNLEVTGKRQLGFALAAGAVFNLANILLVAAISLAGLSVAFPVGIGLALVIGVVWNYVLKPAGNPLFLFGGAALVVVAILVDALAYRMHAVSKGSVQQGSIKGLLLSVVSGILMGSFYPLVQIATAGELGLGPYSVGVVFSVGVLFTTFIFNLYFINLPVQGEPVPIGDYFKGTPANHILGLLGGGIWYAGTIANFVAAAAPGEASVGPAVSYALGQGATMISALWGLLVWHEFRGAVANVKMLLVLMIILFIAGLSLVSVAPLYAS
ncbi:MAG: AcrB/AcrD/AcrF family protein [Bryobacteraceae bacterium]|nr:AcrB/AcrD/AcrF family protein [Bryobacteraceae bacterium]